MRYALSLVLLLFAFSTLSAQNKRFEKGAGNKENTSNSSEKKKEKNTQKQQKEKEPQDIWDRLVYGGGLGLSFGNYTRISLAPQVGYRFNDHWVAGAGVIYNYVKINRIYDPFQGQFVDPNFENTIYGPNFFGNYFPNDKLFFGAQFEYLNFDDYFYGNNQPNPTITNRWTPVLFAQGGYTQPIGEKGFLQVGLRVNLLHDERSPYDNWWSPVINFYF